MRMAPGGNLLYSAIGAKIWTDDVGLFGLVGCDYPQNYLDSLQRSGFDLSGLTRMDTPGIKMWALHEKDGKRQLVYKLDSGHNRDMDPKSEFASDDYVNESSSILIAALPISTQMNLVKRFRGDGRKIVMDTINIPGAIDPTPLRDLSKLSGVDVFLPSVEEVRDIWGDGDLKEIMRMVCEDGKRDMVVKMGSRGSIAYLSGKDEFYSIPIYDVDARDTTGAGDTFCGGFIAGLELYGDIVRAAAMGNVSSSYTVQDFGGVHAIDVSRQQATERFCSVYSNIEKMGE